jgi:hypothetical protein
MANGGSPSHRKHTSKVAGKKLKGKYSKAALKRKASHPAEMSKERND